MLTELLAVCLELGFYRALCNSPGSLTLSPHPPTHAPGLITPTASFWAHQPGSHAPGPSLETGPRNRGRAWVQVALWGPKDQPRPPLEVSRGGSRGAGRRVDRGRWPELPALLPCFLGLPLATDPRTPAFQGGGQPGGPVPHLKLVPMQTGRPNTAILGGEAGQRDSGEGASDCRPGAAGLPEWELPQRSRPDLGLTRASPSLPCPVLLPWEPQASDAERLRFGRAPRGCRHKRSRMQRPHRGPFAVIALRVRKSEWASLG